MSLLKVEDLHVYYGSIHAIKGISFEVNEGEIVTLIGANGAGKSTTLNTIAGLLKPREGRITFDGKNITGMNPRETEELMENIIKIRDQFQIAIMLIEHDMNLVMGICEGICVLNYGRIIAKGTADEIQSNPTVIEAYLGKRKEG